MMLISNAVCCAGQQICNIFCFGCAKLGIPAKNWPKLAYFVLYAICMLGSIVMLFLFRAAADKWSWF
jgi:hypothetical protein